MTTRQKAGLLVAVALGGASVVFLTAQLVDCGITHSYLEASQQSTADALEAACAVLEAHSTGMAKEDLMSMLDDAATELGEKGQIIVEPKAGGEMVWLGALRFDLENEQVTTVCTRG